MVGKECEKMVLISSSTTNEIWPQIDEKNNLMMASNGNTNRDMEKPILDPPQQQQLKCPRCDSSNTKFCYYNNYSLSQPRHFCKACKRYWTRGGTLRNVPVGGGCRKNKRIKRPSVNSSTHHHDNNNNNVITTNSSAPNISTTNPSHHHHHQLHIDHLSSTNSLNPLFYGLTNERSDHHLNIPFARLFNSRVSSGGAVDEGQGYSSLADNIPGLMDRRIGLGFTSPLNVGENNYGGGFNPIKQIQDVVMTSNCTTYPAMFGSSSSSTSSNSTMASLIASSLHQQHKFMSNNGNNFHNLVPNYNEELQMSRGDNNHNINNVHEGGGNEMTMLKEEKMDQGDGQQNNNNINRLNWNNISSNHHQIHEQIINSNDPSLSWNGAWLDPSNMGSNSVPSLI